MECTNRFKQEHPNPEENIIVYKTVIKKPRNKYIYTCWRNTIVILNSKLVARYNTTYKNRNLQDGDEIYGGVIHCFRDIRTALEDVCSKYEIVIECMGKVKDFIAIGIFGDICFTKVFVTEKILYSNYHLHESSQNDSH